MRFCALSVLLVLFQLSSATVSVGRQRLARLAEGNQTPVLAASALTPEGERREGALKESYEKRFVDYEKKGGNWTREWRNAPLSNASVNESDVKEQTVKHSGATSSRVAASVCGLVMLFAMQ
eukprot:CAMPEP_0170597366 /NCGR_PEP_ID=MMETSP0224-20130122/15670_1 /TAXON_ID=285029 /ORGANISM="Togula jolla, Strain CCCM 725" /LENGTH=121 /DNA_ID=CAMNT_0010921835 /DNA_START=55 /DNA_END=420 /DNA_ORIENTATION=+